jgi:hypothetical protein
MVKILECQIPQVRSWSKYWLTMTMSIPGEFCIPIFWPWSYLGDLAFQYFDHELACGIYLSNILTMSIPGGFSSPIFWPWSYLGDLAFQYFDRKINPTSKLMVKILECQIPQVRSWSKYWNAKFPRYAHCQNIGELNPPITIMVKILES